MENEIEINQDKDEVKKENEEVLDKVLDEVVSEVPSISKSQRKKIEKRKKHLEMKKSLRKKEKEKRKMKKLVAKEQGLKLPGPTRHELKNNKMSVESSFCSVAIDLDFETYMTDKDLSSCVAQLLRIYTANRRAKAPLPVYFTSLKPATRMYETLEKNLGWKNWDIKYQEEKYDELFEKDKIIYLTSESDNVMDKLEEGAVYIIGGIVDHNSEKGLTQDLASKSGIRTARLPLTENIILNSRSVLTINQVFEIILGVSEGKSWEDVFMEILPQRKRPKLRNVDNSDESQENKTNLNENS